MAQWDTFSIGFDHRDRARLRELWEQVLDSEQWTEGELVRGFESAWAGWNGLDAVAFGGWAGAAAALLDWADVRGRTVLCPSNTFMATPLSVLRAGGHVQFVDCNREDLCISLADLERKIAEYKPRAVWLVHIGGHIAFDVEAIAELCRSEGVILLEDCAHAHGADWNGRKPGSWGDAGVYSFYATKTISTGEGGMLVSSNPELIEYARLHRNYGKPDHHIRSTASRMNEFTAAIGILQTERLEEIVEWKNAVARAHLDPLYPARLQLPAGMRSGHYKYVVFQPIERSTGKVYEEPCHRILRHPVDLPNTDWVAENHWCVPLYYRSGPIDPLDDALAVAQDEVA